MLAHFDPELLELVTANGQEVSLSPGSWLFRLGDRCEGFGFVIDGSIKVSMSSDSGREMVLYRVRPGESCTVTVSCLVSDRPFPAEGMVEQALQAVSIPRALFHDLVERSGAFRQFVMEVFSTRVNHLMEMVHEVAFNKLDRRLASRLLELGPVIEMTHQDLAAELGTSREMISRLLENFADHEAVELGRKRISIENRHFFEQLCDKG